MAETLSAASSALWAGLVALVFSLLNCFFGYKLQKLWIALMAFAIGAFLAGYCMNVFLPGKTIPLLLVALVVGILFAAVGFKIYKAGVFLLCGGVTFFLCYFLLPTGWQGLAIGAAAGLIVGILSVKFVKPVLILSTGIGSGFSAGHLAGALLPALGGVWGYVIGGLLAIAGVLFQFKTNAGHE